MNPSIRRSFAAGAVLTATLVAGAGLAGCSGDSHDSQDSHDSKGSDGGGATPTAAGKTAAANVSVEMASLVGPGCSAYAAKVPSGQGSVEQMANDPVVTAAGHNPMLKTLTKAVSGKLNQDVDLAASLNGKEYTVFAPVDTAFARLAPATLNSLKKDAPALVRLLTYHVVAGELAPGKVIGEQVTVAGQSLTVTSQDSSQDVGTDSRLKVNDANVICGGIKTANATVYLIDRVLTPPTGS